MNILVVTPLYPTQSDPTIGVFIKKYAEYIKKRGNELSVVVPTPWVPPSPFLPSRWKSYRESPLFAEYDGISIAYPRYLSFPGTTFLPVSSYSCRYTTQKHHKRNFLDFTPDIIHAHVAIPTGLYAVALANEYDVPLVTTVHGADFQTYLEVSGCERIIQRVFNRSDHVIVNSTKLLEIGERKFENVSFTRIPNGVTPTPPPEEPPAEIDLEAFIIVSVGNLIEIKGHRYVLEALKQFNHDNVQYIVIGDGPERDLLEQRADTLDVPVHFTGTIPNENVFAYLWNADVFVLPSYEEAFGIAYLEAMSCELPVIACTGQGPEDYIENEENGFLVEPHSVESIANRLSQLVAKPDLRRKIGKQARKTVEVEYSWEHHAERVESVLESVTCSYNR